MDVTRRFFKRFPPSLPADEEPSPEHLAAVDDSMPDPERNDPDPTLWPEDQAGYAKVLAAHDEETKLIAFRTKVSVFPSTFLFLSLGSRGGCPFMDDNQCRRPRGMTSASLPGTISIFENSCADVEFGSKSRGGSTIASTRIPSPRPQRSLSARNPTSMIR